MMRPQRAAELPLHKSPNKKKSNIAKLNSAFEKGLGMAGVTKTKTGSGEKDKAYVLRENAVLKIVMMVLIIAGVGCVVLFSTLLKINIVKRGAVHSEAVHRKVEHTAQMKLVSLHMQLQQALDSEVHENIRVEEFRSQIEKIFGDKALMLETIFAANKEIPEAVVKDVMALQAQQTDEVLEDLKRLVHQFNAKAIVAKAQLRSLSEKIVKDIEDDDLNRDAFKKRMKELGEDDTFDYQAEVEDDETFESLEDGYLDMGRVKTEVEQFYHRLQTFEFPILDAKIIANWETFLNDALDSLQDEEKETDLNKIKDYFNGQLLEHAPAAKGYDETMKHTSIIDFAEEKIYEAKMAPHKQELLDMYSGWKAGKLTVNQVLANLEKVANDESLYLIYDWLNGEMDHTYYHDGESVTVQK